jgi:hypothetical protein
MVPLLVNWVKKFIKLLLREVSAFGREAQWGIHLKTIDRAQLFGEKGGEDDGFCKVRLSVECFHRPFRTE